MFWYRETVGRIDVAFTDRSDGFSVGPFDSLNLGSSTGDEPSAVHRNHAAVADELGVGGLHSMSQVHGTAVHEAHSLVVDGSGQVPECDALVTEQVGLALLVRVADCVPLLLADPSAGVVAAVHAGRVGLTSGVVTEAVSDLQRRGAGDVHAWVGPRAGPCCYEVPDQMAEAVDRSVPGTRSTTTWGTASIDIGAGVVRQLAGAGVAQIHDLGEGVCTIERDEFFSHRRQGRQSGRFGAVVVLR